MTEIVAKTMRRRVVLHEGDCREVMGDMRVGSVDAIVCDPPYGLSFMGKGWDHGVPGVEFWTEGLRVLKPGGYLLAFGGTRTFHRLAVAIEDAGFEVRDCLSWMYGSGFPKSMDVGKAIDKAAGMVGSKGPMKRGGERLERMAPGGTREDGVLWGTEKGRDPYTYIAGSPEAAQWQGWGTALKPAWEPIIMARKPLGKGVTVAANVLAHGTGAINVDRCRIGMQEGEVLHTPQSDPGKREGVVGTDLGITSSTVEAFQAAQVASIERTKTMGRWPANVMLTHDEGCEQVGEITERVWNHRSGNGSVVGLGTEDGMERYQPGDASTKQVTSTVWQCVNGCPVRLLDEQSVGASRFFYNSKVSKKERNNGLPEGAVNNHPTVKPVAVMAWLCRLVTPPGGTVLDPFMGSGSTGVAAKQEGFRFIGIDLDAEYCNIARHRIGQ